MGLYSHSVSLDAAIMVSKNWPAIGEHVTIFVTKYLTIGPVLPAKNILKL